MLETIVIILLVLWLLGLVTSYTMGGFIHVLLVIAVVVVLVRIIQKAVVSYKVQAPATRLYELAAGRSE